MSEEYDCSFPNVVCAEHGCLCPLDPDRRDYICPVHEAEVAERFAEVLAKNPLREGEAEKLDRAAKRLIDPFGMDEDDDEEEEGSE